MESFNRIVGVDGVVINSVPNGRHPVCSAVLPALVLQASDQSTRIAVVDCGQLENIKPNSHDDALHATVLAGEGPCSDWAAFDIVFSASAAYVLRVHWLIVPSYRAEVCSLHGLHSATSNHD